jgi:hypothetical protein
MTRTRRVSIELIRRELRLLVGKPVAANGETMSQPAVRDVHVVQLSPPTPLECPAGASPWFVLSAGGGDQAAIVQRALGKHGIHTQLSPTGELLVCSRSFELHIRASDSTQTVTSKEYAVVGQTLRYMSFVQEVLAEKDQVVKGIIIAIEDDQRIRRALSMVPSIDFYRYQISFKLVKN